MVKVVNIGENMKNKIKLSNNQDFTFNKGYGQNFIFDKTLLNSIAEDALITKDDQVLEIGAGAGTLTQVLCDKAGKVVSYEIDKNLFDHLTRLQSKNNNLKMVFADFMSKTIDEVFADFDRPIKVVANIPYYITTPIIFRLMEKIDNIESITIMVQKEVAERIASHDTSENSVLTYSILALCDAKITRVVKRDMFTPPPNVDSAILMLTPHNNKYNIQDFDAFNNLVKHSFTARRKTLANNLSLSFGLAKQEVEDMLQRLFDNKQIRAQELSVQDYILLLNELNKNRE